jgi:hypothetical protein
VCSGAIAASIARGFRGCLEAPGAFVFVVGTPSTRSTNASRSRISCDVGRTKQVPDVASIVEIEVAIIEDGPRRSSILGSRAVAE